MTLPPIVLSDLDPAGPVDPANDLLLIRQGLADKKITAGNIVNPALGILDPLPSNIVASDVFLIGRSDGLGAYGNYITPAFNVTLPSGTRCWFHNSVAPLGWTIDNGFGDRVLAVSGTGGLNQYQVPGGSAAGDWQQYNHNLTVSQLPPHSHRVPSGKSSSGRSNNPSYARRASDLDLDDVITTDTGNGLLGQGHNHGDLWRPAAAVGILAKKNNI